MAGRGGCGNKIPGRANSACVGLVVERGHKNLTRVPASSQTAAFHAMDEDLRGIVQRPISKGPVNIAVDRAFVAEQRALTAARAARFAKEAANPPPAPPPKVLAHPGGKIVTSDKREKLLSLLARQSSPPTAAQRQALAAMNAAAGLQPQRWPIEHSGGSSSSSSSVSSDSATDAKRRRRTVQWRRASRFKRTPHGRHTCTVTAFIFRRRRRLLKQRFVGLVRGYLADAARK